MPSLLQRLQWAYTRFAGLGIVCYALATNQPLWASLGLAMTIVEGLLVNWLSNRSVTAEHVVRLETLEIKVRNLETQVSFQQ